LDLRAVEPEQGFTLFDVLTGLVDEQIFDEAVGSKCDDRQQSFVVLHPSYGAHFLHDVA